MLINNTSIAKMRLVQIIERIHGNATTGQSETFHVAALGAAQGDDALLGEHIQRQRVDSLHSNPLSNRYVII